MGGETAHQRKAARRRRKIQRTTALHSLENLDEALEKDGQTQAFSEPIVGASHNFLNHSQGEGRNGHPVCRSRHAIRQMDNQAPGAADRKLQGLRNYALCRSAKGPTRHVLNQRAHAIREYESLLELDPSISRFFLLPQRYYRPTHRYKGVRRHYRAWRCFVPQLLKNSDQRNCVASVVDYDLLARREYQQSGHCPKPLRNQFGPRGPNS